MVEYAFGPLLLGNGVEFRLWAPLVKNVSVVIEGDGSRPMQRSDDGWHRVRVAGAQPGALYQFLLPDGSKVPDPGSRHQPDDVHGPSEVIDLNYYHWKSQDWTGRSWEESVIYELHVGTFTTEGTFAAATHKLAHLAKIGVTAIQIMPVSDFPGRYNWGYDGVYPMHPTAAMAAPKI